MPLTPLVERYRGELRSFVTNPNASALCVVAAPEAEPFAAKLVASIEDEPESDDVVLAYTGEFRDAVSFYRAAAAAVLENFSEHRATLAKEHAYFTMPAGLDEAYRAPGVSIEVLFAEFAERCARALFRNVARRLIFLLRAEEPSDGAAFLASATLLASLTAAERTKFIAFNAPAGVTSQVVPGPQRLNVVEPGQPRELAGALGSFFSRVTSRVFVVRSQFMHAESVRAEVSQFLDGLRRPVFKVVLRPGVLASVVDAAAQELNRLGRARGLPGDTPDLTLEPADRLAALCEELARQLSPERGELSVVLELQGWSLDQSDAARSLIIGLRNAACSPRVRYVVLDPVGFFPRIEESSRPFDVMHVKVESSALEEGLLAKLQKPDLPPEERVATLQGLALLASARGQHQAALSLQDQALGWAEQVNQPLTTLMLWSSIGHTLYRAESWEAAENAYSKALQMALDASQSASVADNMMHLANALLCGNKLADAQTCYQSAADWYDKLSVPLLALHARTWLGEAQARAGDAQGAEKTWEAALTSYSELGDDLRDMKAEGKKQVLARLVKLHQQRGNVGRAALRENELAALGPAPTLTERP